MTDLVKFGVLSSIFVTVLATGLVATWRDAIYLVRTPGLLARSFFSMFIVMPIICIGAALLFHLPPAIKVALVAFSISPVPPFLQRKELMAGGHKEFVVSLLSLAAVLSIVFVPIVSSLFGQWFNRPADVPPQKVALMVLVTILIPLILGMALRSRMPVLADKAAGPAGLAGIGLLVVCLVPLAIKFWPLLASFFGDGTVLVLALIGILGTAVGHFLGGPDTFERSVLALSTSARHPGVALAIATSADAEGKRALGAVLLYVLVVNIVTVPYVIWSVRQSRGSAATR